MSSIPTGRSLKSKRNQLLQSVNPNASPEAAITISGYSQEDDEAGGGGDGGFIIAPVVIPPSAMADTPENMQLVDEEEETEEDSPNATLPANLTKSDSVSSVDGPPTQLNLALRISNDKCRYGIEGDEVYEDIQKRRMMKKKQQQASNMNGSLRKLLLGNGGGGAGIMALNSPPMPTNLLAQSPTPSNLNFLDNVGTPTDNDLIVAPLNLATSPNTSDPNSPENSVSVSGQSPAFQSSGLTLSSTLSGGVTSGNSTFKTSGTSGVSTKMKGLVVEVKSDEEVDPDSDIVAVDSKNNRIPVANKTALPKIKKGKLNASLRDASGRSISTGALSSAAEESPSSRPTMKAVEVLKTSESGENDSNSMEWTGQGGIRMGEWVIDGHGITKAPVVERLADSSPDVSVNPDAPPKTGSKGKKTKTSENENADTSNTPADSSSDTLAKLKDEKEMSLDIGDMHMTSPSGNLSKVHSLDFIPFGSRLGRGNSGTVAKALNVQDFHVYALKSIRVHLKANREQIVKELHAFHKLDCPYLVSFHGAFLDKGSTTFVLEYMNRGSLQDVIDNHGAVEEPVLKRITKMICLGLKKMHSQRLVHRDIKPANILLNRAGQAKISDFGIIKQLNNKEEAQSVRGTWQYMAPERLSSQAYSYSADIWSLGLTIHTLATGEFPYKGIDRGFFYLFQAVTSDAVPKLARSKFSNELRSFIGHCLEKDPQKRYTAKQLLEHPFLADVDISEAMIWPWDDKEGPQKDFQDLSNLAEILGKVVFSKNLYRRSAENTAIFAKVAESLCIPTQDAQIMMERNLPLKSLAESPFN